MWQGIVARAGIMVPLILALALAIAWDVVERVRFTYEAFVNNNGQDGIRITCAEQDKVDQRRAPKFWTALRAMSKVVPFAKIDSC